MGARFIGCDRDQVFLMPPSLRDRVPEGHLVWPVLDAAGELDVSAIYVDYRDDGPGRPESCRRRAAGHHKTNQTIWLEIAYRYEAEMT